MVKAAADAVSSLLRGDDEANFRVDGSPKLPNREFVFDPLKGASQTVMGYRIEVEPIADPTLFERIRSGVRDHQSCLNASFCVPLTTPVQVRVRHSAGIDVETVLSVVDPTRAIGI